MFLEKALVVWREKVIINIEYFILDQMMNLGYVLDSKGCYNKFGIIYIG